MFFGSEIISPWGNLPKKGRIISPSMRHITLAFLGLCKKIPLFPSLSFSLAPASVFDKILFLSEDHPRVISYRTYFPLNIPPFKCLVIKG